MACAQGIGRDIERFSGGGEAVAGYEDAAAVLTAVCPRTSPPVVFRVLDSQRPTNTAQILRRAVSGMLPKNTFRDRRLERLKIFPGEAPTEYTNNVLKTWRDAPK